MDWFKEFFRFLAALLAVVTVAVQFLGARRDRTSRPSGSPLVALKVAKDRETTYLSTKVRPTRRVPSQLAQWLVILIVYGVLAVDLADWAGTSILGTFNFFLFWGTTYWAGFMVVLNIIPFFTLVRARFKGPPWVRRQAEVTVAGTDIQAVQDQCVVALRKMGAILAEHDSANGIIKAVKRPGRFFLTQLVDYITVTITSLDDYDRIQIIIESDGVRPSLSPDRRRNASNVNQFIDHLVE